jgi:hypothetical protein
MSFNASAPILCRNLGMQRLSVEDFYGFRSCAEATVQDILRHSRFLDSIAARCGGTFDLLSCAKLRQLINKKFQRAASQWCSFGKFNLRHPGGDRSLKTENRRHIWPFDE